VARAWVGGLLACALLVLLQLLPYTIPRLVHELLANVFPGG
jgi:hypothetical protein